MIGLSALVIGTVGAPSEPVRSTMVLLRSIAAAVPLAIVTVIARPGPEISPGPIALTVTGSIFATFATTLLTKVAGALSATDGFVVTVPGGTVWVIFPGTGGGTGVVATAAPEVGLAVLVLSVLGVASTDEVTDFVDEPAEAGPADRDPADGDPVDERGGTGAVVPDVDRDTAPGRLESGVPEAGGPSGREVATA